MKKTENYSLSQPFTLALPKGRILKETDKIIEKLGIKIEADFYNDNSRKLSFTTNISNLSVIRVRSFDIATFVTTKMADLAICGYDVLAEFNYHNIFCLRDLKLGQCRLSLACNQETDISKIGHHVKIATKYPNLSKKFFLEKGLQCEIIKLSGAIELAANLKFCDAIVDLVSTGKTLKENNLIEKETILDVSSRLIVNRNSFNTNLTFCKQILKALD